MTRKGFHLRYHAICGADLLATEEPQKFYSHPSDGEPYEKSMACTWLITVPEHEESSLSAEMIKKRQKIRKEERRSDYLARKRKRERNMKNRNRINYLNRRQNRNNRRHNNERAKDVKRRVEKRIQADEALSKRIQGLKSYRERMLKRRQKQSDTEKVAIWKPSKSHVLILEFEYMDTEKSDCKFDYVEIFDGDNEKADLIGTFCGDQVPGVIITSSSQALVKFTTDESMFGKGFLLSYRSLPKSEIEDFEKLIGKRDLDYLKSATMIPEFN